MTEAEQLLVKVAIQLELWAEESKRDGWSTHQVQPQRDLAAEIKVFIYDSGALER